MSAHLGMCSAIEKIIKDLNRVADIIFFDLDFFGLQWTKHMLRVSPYELFAENVVAITLHQITEITLALIPGGVSWTELNQCRDVLINASPIYILEAMYSQDRARREKIDWVMKVVNVLL